jgi:hypothetical protein
MYRTNPIGRVPRTSQKAEPIYVGEGERVHLRSPVTGLPLCMPSRNATKEGRAEPGKGNTSLSNITRAAGQQVTCMRCEKLMTINHDRTIGGGDDLAIGDAEEFLVRARAARRS